MKRRAQRSRHRDHRIRYGNVGRSPGYVNYSINSQWSATLRDEGFGDNGGLRTGESMRWGEATATPQWAPNNNVILRGELRGDKTNQPFFVGIGGNKYYSNAQFGIEAIVKWP